VCSRGVGVTPRGHNQTVFIRNVVLSCIHVSRIYWTARSKKRHVSYITTNKMHQISKIYFVIKLYMVRASSVPIIRSYLLYARQLVRFMQVMWPLPSSQVGTAVATWWAQKMPETRRILWQNKFWIFDASSWLFYTKLVTMHGHLNIKYERRHICVISGFRRGVRSTLFWYVAQRRLVVSYWRFGTIFSLGLLGPWRWDRYVVPKRP
jgi:hypothetical protein